MINLFSALGESQGERQLNVVLAWLLEAVPSATTGLMAHLGIAVSPLKEQFVEFQAGSNKVGFPDLVVTAHSSSGEKILLVIELKLEAQLTEHQRTGYAAFRASQEVPRSYFILVGPASYQARYKAEISHLEGAAFLSMEDFIGLLGSMGPALPLGAFANDLRQFFLPRPIPRGQIQRELSRAGELSKEEREKLSARLICVQLRDALLDRHPGKIRTGPVIWGRLEKADPWIGFSVKGVTENKLVVAVGFWLRSDLEEGVPFFFQTNETGIADALKDHGHVLEPAQFTTWGKYEWIPHFDLETVTVDGILDHTGALFADLAEILAARTDDGDDEPAA